MTKKQYLQYAYDLIKSMQESMPFIFKKIFKIKFISDSRN
jgi:hypothetical protein